MTSTSHEDDFARRLLVAFIVVLGALVVFLNLSPKEDPKVRLANDTVRVDYEDGVSCYHRGDAMSCVYVPSRAPMGPAAPAVLVEDILEPDTAIIPTTKKRSRK